jgi:hypothetical protein
VTLTVAQIQEVPCSICGAKESKPCRAIPLSNLLPNLFDRTAIVQRAIQDGCHGERIMLAERINSLLRPGLTATDKALIVYYAYVMLADSISSRVPELGDSQTIQSFFAKNAIHQLIVDGLLNEPTKGTDAAI